MDDNQKLFDALKELQVIEDSQLESAQQQAQAANVPLGEMLLEKDLISEEDLAKLTGQLLSIPFIQLKSVIIAKDILNLLPEATAKDLQAIPFKQDAKGMHVAMTDPANTATLVFLAGKFKVTIIPYITTAQDMTNAFKLYLKDISQVFADVINQSVQEAQNKKDQPKDPPIIKIVETILMYAYNDNASDIHLEPEEKVALVRFRIDGVLHDIIQVPLELYLQVVSRIKIMAKLRTDEHLTPQDGKIEFTFENTLLDIRVSIVPIRRGEKIVMRLLSESNHQISLEGLGFSRADLEKVKIAYQKPYGMILSTGPTGSGKTTTMYAILALLNNRDVNIMTIEDPIEYAIEGINQIQVNPKTDVTFVNGLRSILRQDPNIILVGEIRDEETAAIAINAAMTGHLMLSTLHTNDAATAIPRLLDMKIEPFLVASTANVIIGQRLIRKIHSVCRVSEDISLQILEKTINTKLIEKIFGIHETTRLYKGKGCELCHHSGYEGRIGIYEVMEVTDQIKQAIVEKQSAADIRNIAIQEGMTTMLQDGLEKVKTGETTIEELLRVTKE